MRGVYDRLGCPGAGLCGMGSLTVLQGPSALLLLLRGDVRADLGCVARAVGLGRKQVCLCAGLVPVCEVC